MGKKKRGHPDVEEILGRPWCYYCERDFDDLKILINHQKAKHFKCERCGRRLNTAGGLSVHMSQVHKEQLSAVDNALPNRAGLDIEIFGMEGIPEDIVQTHNQRVLTTFHQAEAERLRASGNGPPGSAAGGQAKKPKVEEKGSLKDRLAAHKAKKEAELAGGSSGDVTPMGAGVALHSPAPVAIQPVMNQNPNGYPQTPQAASPSYSQQQQPPYNGHSAMAHSAYQPPHVQQGPPFQQPQPGGFQAQQNFGPPPFQHHQASGPQYPNQPFSPAPMHGMPMQNMPPQHLPQQGMPPQHLPQQGMPPHHLPQQGMPPQNFPPQFQSGPPRPFVANSPPAPYHPQQQPLPIHTPPQNGVFPPRSGSGSLPAAPGLPQRPSFGAPQVNAFQMQQMHQGQIPPPAQAGAPPPATPHPYTIPTSHNGQTQHQLQNGPSQAAVDTSMDATSLDDLISGASKQADELKKASTPKPEEPVVEEKAGKKQKDKTQASKLVYSDNETSPEEKMARLPRYAFVPRGKQGTVAAGTTGAVEGAALDTSQMVDVQG